MASIEERVAYLEGKVEEHSYAWQDLRDRITHMEQKFEQRFLSLDQKIDRFRDELAGRIGETHGRIDETNKRIDETNKRIDGTNKRIDGTNKRIDRLFFFILATMASAIGSLIATILK